MSTHQIERVGARDYRCGACGWAWTRPPVSSCPGVPRYGGWEVVPPHLKTKTQLTAAGLQPDGPVRGCVEGKRTWQGETWYWLYDEREATPRRVATPAQRAALARAREVYDRQRRTCPRCQRMADWPLDGDLCPNCEAEEWEAERAADRAGVVAWARDLLGRADWVVLDTETTGLDADAEIVELAIVAPDGTALLDTRIRPTGPIPAAATAIHGLTDADVAAAPSFLEVYRRLVAILTGRTVVAYNAGFDRARLRAAYARYGLRRPAPVRWQCAMEEYAPYAGAWSDYWADYRWQPLPGGGHRAVQDCRAVLALLRRMAQDDPEDRADWMA